MEIDEKKLEDILRKQREEYQRLASILVKNVLLLIQKYWGKSEALEKRVRFLESKIRA